MFGRNITVTSVVCSILYHLFYYVRQISLSLPEVFFFNFSPDFIQIVKVVHIWILHFRQVYSSHFVKIIIHKIYLPVLLCQ
jgi:hypothetical protein